MREFELTIDEAFTNGLSPFDKPPINSQYLSGCLGFKCEDGGLVIADVLDNPFPSALSIDTSWPFPQVIIGEGYNILAIKDSITGYVSIYNVSDDFQTTTFLYEIQPVLYPTTLLEVADFGRYIFMTTGSSMVYYDVSAGEWQRVIDIDNIPNMRTVCNFKGQAIGGCVLSDWYNADEKYYVWSRIGSMDFTIDKDNEAGYRRCPYGGTVYHIRRLGDVAVGYSSGGITLIYPGGSATPEYGSGATFGFKGINGTGVLNRGAINGSDVRQVYVGSDYRVREVTSEGVKELGYRSFMLELEGEDIIVNYDTANDVFYIGNSSKTFLLTKQGMSEILQNPSTVWSKGGQSYMFPDSLSYADPVIATTPFDMSYRGEKTIFSMETDAEGYEDGEVGLDWSNAPTSWGTDYFKPLNNQGIGSIVVAGNSFRFKLRLGTLYSNFKVSYLKIRYKMTDMRGIRGVYAPPPRGQ